MATTEEIRKILESGDFTAFETLRESQWFDAKGRKPYDLDQPAGRYEFAKDVCAFCNADGGYLVIGLQHEPILEEDTERVSGVELFGTDELDLAIYRGVVREYVHPEIKGLAVEWASSRTDPSIGVAYVYTPQQSADSMPFLIKNVVEKGQSLKHIVFGMSRRVGAASVPLTVHELHHRLKHGMSTVAERLTSIEQKLDEVIQRKLTREETPLSRLSQRVRDILSR